MKVTYSEECAQDGDHDGQEDDQKKAKSGALVAGGLRVYNCERE